MEIIRLFGLMSAETIREPVLAVLRAGMTRLGLIAPQRCVIFLRKLGRFLTLLQANWCEYRSLSYVPPLAPASLNSRLSAREQMYALVMPRAYPALYLPTYRLMVKLPTRTAALPFRSLHSLIMAFSFVLMVWLQVTPDVERLRMVTFDALNIAIRLLLECFAVALVTILLSLVPTLLGATVFLVIGTLSLLDVIDRLWLLMQIVVWVISVEVSLRPLGTLVLM